MEQQLQNDLAFHKFIPFIQLHEFEAMLFANPNELQKWLALSNTLPPNCFTNILQAAPDANPDLINEGTETAPSKRILALCDDYDKVDDGLLILKEIGLKNIRTACRHFNEWLTILEHLPDA